MKEHEFYQKYANLPLEERRIVVSIDGIKNLAMSPNELYEKIHYHREKVREAEFQIESFLEIAEKLFNSKKQP